MVQCCVLGCSEQSNFVHGKKLNSKCNFYTFPGDRILRVIWQSKVGRLDDKFNALTARVCEKHFSDDQFMDSVKFNLGFLKKKPLYSLESKRKTN